MVKSGYFQKLLIGFSIFICFGLSLLFLTGEAMAQDDVFLELSGYIGGDGTERANAAVIHQTGDWKYIYVVGHSTSRESWMPPGPRKGGIAPGCPKEPTKECSGIGGPDNGFIARYTISGEPSGFAFLGNPGGLTEITDITVNNEGHIFIAGWTSEELTYGRNLYNGGRDAFVARLDTTKFDPNDTGSALDESNSPVRWAKHIGGEDEDRALAITVNDLGNPVVVGKTASEDFPTAGTKSQSRSQTDDDSVRFDNEVQNKKVKTKLGEEEKPKEKIQQQPNTNTYKGGSYDAFVTILSKDGLTIKSSYFLGGSKSDIARDIAIYDKITYIAGETKSNSVKSPWGSVSNNSGSATTNGFIFQNNLVSVNKDTGRIISRDDGDQVATGVAIIEDGLDRPNIAVAGYTTSGRFGGASDGFVATFNSLADNKGKAEVFRLYGRRGEDRINSLEALNQEYDDSFLYVTGDTDSDGFPVEGSFDPKFWEHNGGKDAFMMMLDNSGNSIIYSALIGGNSDDLGLGLAVTDNQIFNIFGTTYSEDFIFNNAPDGTLEGNSDGFMTRLTPDDQKPTNVALEVDVPREFRMEKAPIPFDIEIENTSDTKVNEVTLTGNIEGGTITSTPSECKTSGTADITCRYGIIDARGGLESDKSLNIQVHPNNAPRMLEANFNVSSASREYKIDDNKWAGSVEVLSKIDLAIDHIEVTQGIQDKQHSIPLVRDKATYARVYVKATRQTVDSGELLVNTGPFTAELTGRDKNGEFNSHIKPSDNAPTTLKQLGGVIRGTSVSANDGDTLNGFAAAGRVGSGNDGFYVTGNAPSVNSNNPSNSDIEVYDKNTIVITGKEKTGKTEYTVIADSILDQPNRTILGHRVRYEIDQDDLNSEATKVTGIVENDADGIIFEGKLHKLKLSNPSAADVLVERGSEILIKGTGGGTNYTFRDTLKMDANTFDRHGQQAFDFRLPNEWIDGEQIQLEAMVNSNNSIDESHGGFANSKKTQSYKLWQLSPICVRTQPVRTNSSLPNADLRDNAKGPEMLKLAETLMPTPRIRIYPNPNVVTPGWAEPGNTFELDKPNDNDDGDKIIWLLGERALMSSPPSWCDQRGARTHWAGLVNPNDASYGGRGKNGGKLFWVELDRTKNDWGQINSPDAGTSIAHELGHNYSFNHVNCPPGSPDGPYEIYPFNNCLLGPDNPDAFFGYDTREPESGDTPKYAGQRGIHPNLPVAEPSISSNMSDQMSYADHRWPSSYNWMTLFLKFNRGLREPSGSKINPAFGKKNNIEAMLLKEQSDSSSQKILPISADNDNQMGGPMIPMGISGYQAFDFSIHTFEPSSQRGNMVSARKVDKTASVHSTSLQDELTLVKGLINVERQTSIRLEATQLERSAISPDKVEQLLKTGKQNPDYPVRVILKDANGGTIASKAVQLNRISHSDKPGQRMLTTALPWSSGIDEVEVAMRNKTLGHISIADSAPNVEITSPQEGDFMKGELFTIKWDVTGIPNSAEVRYMIHYSPNNGKSWQPISMNHKSQMMKIDPADLSGSNNNARLRVIAVWKGRSDQDISDPFRVAGHKPDTKIRSPKEGKTYQAGGQAYLKGTAYDMDDGYLSGNALKWQITDSNGNKILSGKSESLTVFDLKPGTYTVTLTGTDSDGMGATSTRRITVKGSTNTLSEGGHTMNIMEEKKYTKPKIKDEPDQSGQQKKSETQPDINPDDKSSNLTLVPKGGFTLPGISSLGDIPGSVGSSIDRQSTNFTWGASLTFGKRNSFASFRLSGIRRTGRTSEILQNDQITTTEIDENFTALSADLTLRPIPRIIVQPYAIGGIGIRKISIPDSNPSGINENWKMAVPVGLGADLQLGKDGLILGVEVVDYISRFSGEGQHRHDSFLFGYIGIPL